MDFFFICYLCIVNMVILLWDIIFDEYIWIFIGFFWVVEWNDECLVLEVFDGYFFERLIFDWVEFWIV